MVLFSNVFNQSKIRRQIWPLRRRLSRIKKSFQNVLHVAGLFVQYKGGMLKAFWFTSKLIKAKKLAGVHHTSAVLKYAQWLRTNQTLTQLHRETMNNNIKKMLTTPLVSIVMPVYNPDIKWLEDAIKSIQSQVYPYWELCIADDCSTDGGVHALLEKYMNTDKRIKVDFRKENEHISAASNSALTLAQGEWVALMDQDDLLSQDALYWVIDAINTHPDSRLIYSDEDKIDENDDRFAPYFKCDWNLDLFYSQNMFSHLGVYHKPLLNEVGGFRQGFEGAQDYDLVLRCIEKISHAQIIHIPRVLYHWRAHSGSTALAVSVKPYVEQAVIRALTEHFQRQQIDALVELTECGNRIRYKLPSTPPRVSLIIPTRNNYKFIQRCIESIIEKTIYPNYDIIIVDNGSDDVAVLDYLNFLSTDPRIRILKDDGPFNHSRLNNAAVKIAKGEVLGLLNDDIEVISPDWLSEMVSHALQPKVGAVGAKLLYRNNTLQHAGTVLGMFGLVDHACKHLPRNHTGYFGRVALVSSFSAVTAACLIIKKSLFEVVGGFDEDNLPTDFNDVDFCLRVRALGFRNVYTPFAELYHFESATRGYDKTLNTPAGKYMQAQWGEVLNADPSYSPHLSLLYGDFSLAPQTRVAPVSPMEEGVIE